MSTTGNRYFLILGAFPVLQALILTFSFKISKITCEFDPCSITYYFTITIVANASKLKEEISGDCSEVEDRAACNSGSVLFGVKSCQVLPLLIGVPAFHPANISERMSKAATLDFNCFVFSWILGCQFQHGLWGPFRKLWEGCQIESET